MQRGQLFNVNADTLAAHLAVRLGASRLIMAGSTRGVLDSGGRTIARLNLETLDQLITKQDVTAGMIAKLLACRRARQAGVAEVVVADGRDTRNIEMPIGYNNCNKRTSGSNWMRSTLKDVQELESRHILQVYRRLPIEFVDGEGCQLFDRDGHEYLDLVSGIGVTSLGHKHPDLVAALIEQTKGLLHISNLYYHSLQGQVARHLAELSGLSRVFFGNSGTEAVEACLKFARRYWHTKGDTTRTKFHCT